MRRRKLPPTKTKQTQEYVEAVKKGLRKQKYEKGLTKSEVLDRIGRDGWMEFYKWIAGQGCPLAEDGTHLYFTEK